MFNYWQKPTEKGTLSAIKTLNSSVACPLPHLPCLLTSRPSSCAQTSLLSQACSRTFHSISSTRLHPHDLLTLSSSFLYLSCVFSTRLVFKQGPKIPHSGHIPHRRGVIYLVNYAPLCTSIYHLLDYWPISTSTFYHATIGTGSYS